MSGSLALARLRRYPRVAKSPNGSKVRACFREDTAAMESGDVLGHETMGEEVEVGAENKALKVGDRVLVVRIQEMTAGRGICAYRRYKNAGQADARNRNVRNSAGLTA